MGAMLVAALGALIGSSDVQQHHVKVLKDYGGNVSFLDGPTWQYTGVTVTGSRLLGRQDLDRPAAGPQLRSKRGVPDR